MSEEDDKRLARILDQTAARKKAEEDKANFAREHAENRRKQIEEAKPRIEAGVRQILASVSTVGEELKQAGCVLKVFDTPRSSGAVDIVIRASAPGTGYSPVDGSFTINELGNVHGAEFMSDTPSVGVRVEELTHAKLRAALIGMAERVLRIRVS